MKRLLLLALALVVCKHERAPLQVSLLKVGDYRSSSGSTRNELDVIFWFNGADADAVKFTRPHLTKAIDDTGRSLMVQDPSGQEGWQYGRGFEVTLASPARKAKKLVLLEGVVETYLPSVDKGPWSKWVGSRR